LLGQVKQKVRAPGMKEGEGKNRETRARDQAKKWGGSIGEGVRKNDRDYSTRRAERALLMPRRSNGRTEGGSRRIPLWLNSSRREVQPEKVYSTELKKPLLAVQEGTLEEVCLQGCKKQPVGINSHRERGRSFREKQNPKWQVKRKARGSIFVIVAPQHPTCGLINTKDVEL